MASQNIAYKSIRYVLIDLIGDILYWPLWWYSRGLINTAFFCFNEIAQQEERLGVRIWIRNLFTPMFGQYDIEGRIISFIMRLIQILFRSLLLLIWSIVIWLLLLAWIFLPVVFGYFAWTNFIAIAIP